MSKSWIECGILTDQLSFTITVELTLPFDALKWQTPFASTAKGQVLHLVWCRFNDAKISKKSVNLFQQKSSVHKSRVNKCTFHGSRKNRKIVSRERKYRFTNHGKINYSFTHFTPNKNAHSCVTKKIGYSNYSDRFT